MNHQRTTGFSKIKPVARWNSLMIAYIFFYFSPTMATLKRGERAFVRLIFVGSASHDLLEGHIRQG